MRLLIDGYNLMFAGGHMGPRMGPDRLRKVRQRFLNDLAEALDPVDAHQTTIVFDATDPPPHLDKRASHKGMTVLFAVDEDEADERIEALIQGHPDPKRLKVVSSDNRVRLAATRRRAMVSTSDEFLDHLERLKADRARKRSRDEAPASAKPIERPERISESESAYWVEQFRDLEDSRDFREVSAPSSAMLTDQEIARIAREVAREDGPADWRNSAGRKRPK